MGPNHIFAIFTKSRHWKMPGSVEYIPWHADCRCV